jgi:hypothetical protein
MGSTVVPTTRATSLRLRPEAISRSASDCCWGVNRRPLAGRRRARLCCTGPCFFRFFM